MARVEIRVLSGRWLERGRRWLERGPRWLSALPELWGWVRSSRRRQWGAFATLGLVLAALTTWIVWPEPAPEPEPRAREYLAFTACLLTDGRGVAGAEAAAVWAGLQDASLKTHAKVQYLPVEGEPGVVDAGPYLAGLLQRRCSVVIAVGSAQVAAARSAAAEQPDKRYQVTFVVVEGTADGATAPSASKTSTSQTSTSQTSSSAAANPTSSGRLTAVAWTTPAEVRSRVSAIVRDAVERSGERLAGS